MPSTELGVWATTQSKVDLRPALLKVRQMNQPQLQPARAEGQEREVGSGSTEGNG